MHHLKTLGAAITLGLLITTSANAHIGYTGRNFGTLVVNAPATTISGQTISSAFGWADATDSDWGDSHRGRFFRFTLTSVADVIVTAQRSDLGSQTGQAGVFLPGISLFQGLGHLAPFQGSHDSAALSVASRPVGKEGSLRTTTDWSIGNDPTYNTPGDPSSGTLYAADLRNFAFIGYAVDGTSTNFGPASGVVGDGAADGFVTATFANVGPGDYSIFVGGADYGSQATQTGAPYPTYGVSLTVQAIPEPQTIALIGLGLAACLLKLRSHRRETAKN